VLAHQGSKSDPGVTEQERALQLLFFFSHYCQIFKILWEESSWGRKRREKLDLVFLISRSRREAQDLCHTVSTLPQRKVKDTWQKLNVNVSNHVQKHIKLKGQLMIPFENKI